MATRRKNPRNAESQLFRKLTKLLSGPLVNYRRQLPRKIKRRQLDKFKLKSASGQQFQKTAYSPYETLQANFMANQNRMDRYIDFDQMEYTPEIASALDIYADEMTTSSDLKNLLTIKCANEEIKAILENLYINTLNLEFNLFGWCRTMCKYGDFFLYLDVDEIEGIKYVIALPPHEVERMEGEDKTNPNYVQYQWNSGGLTFENWQVAHFRILGNDKYSPYGTSVLDPARRIWRQLTLLEDAMMAYRIVRSPERRVFYVDVGNIAVEDVEQYMQKVMSQMKRNQVIDQDTGRVDLRYNPMSVEEDYFIPTRAGVSTKVETLAGGQYTGDIDDVKYLRDKLFSALKVPASYISRAEGAEEDKTTLAQKDVRFARTVQRLQRAVVSELEKIGIVHLFTLGYRSSDLINFELSLNNPSKIAELQELEHWRTKFDVARGVPEGFFSQRWIAQNVFSLSDEEVIRMQRESFYDRKLAAELEMAVEQSVQEAASDMGLGPAPGEEPMPEEGAPGAEEAPPGGAGEMPPEEEPDIGTLLSEPTPEESAEAGDEIVAKRDDGSYLTAGSNDHWYKPVPSDLRRLGARRRSMSDDQMASSSKRNTLKGWNELMSLVGLSEDKTTTYIDQERKIFETNTDIKKLIKELEDKELAVEDET